MGEEGDVAGATPAQAESSNGVEGRIEEPGGGEAEARALSRVAEDAQAGVEGNTTKADPPDGGNLELLKD